MRVIPNVIHHTNSNAERKVFDLLKGIDMGPGWKAYHSLNVSEHQYKQWAELDFVIVGPEGIVVLEIKGGRIACEGGIWSFTDRYGVVHKKSEGPFKQAETGMYALRDKVSDNFGAGWQHRVKIGWGVVFPDIPFTKSSPEMPREVICDERCTRSVSDFKAYLGRLIRYWNNKGRSVPVLQPDDVFLSDITNYLRPSFDVSPSLRNRVDSIQQEIVQLSQEQYKILDAFEQFDRIICSGGAGTGKTFLAVEATRRELENKNRVLFVALHEIFVTYLKAQIKNDRLRICTFSELGKTINELSKNPYDVLMVDEGQDLLTMDNLAVLEKTLIHGIDGGRWRWFMDKNFQAGIIGRYDPDAMEYLKSTGAAPMTLKYNCRNTRQIVKQTQVTTGAYVGITEIKGNGPRVEYCNVVDRSDEAMQITRNLESWINDGVELSDIVILSPASYEESVVRKLPTKWYRRLRKIDKINVMVPGAGVLLFSSIEDFKGLEKKYVMLVDTDFLDNTDKSVSLIYVAMTRAHAGLWISVGEDFKSLLQKMQESNLMKQQGVRTSS